MVLTNQISVYARVRPTVSESDCRCFHPLFEIVLQGLRNRRSINTPSAAEIGGVWIRDYICNAMKSYYIGGRGLGTTIWDVS